MVSAAHAQQPIVNGSFETGNYDSWGLTNQSGTSSQFGTWGIARDEQTITSGESTLDFFDDPPDHPGTTKWSFTTIMYKTASSEAER